MFLLLECLLPLQLIKKLSDLFVSQSCYAEALELTKSVRSKLEIIFSSEATQGLSKVETIIQE